MEKTKAGLQIRFSNLKLVALEKPPGQSNSQTWQTSRTPSRQILNPSVRGRKYMGIYRKGLHTQQINTIFTIVFKIGKQPTSYERKE